MNQFSNEKETRAKGGQNMVSTEEGDTKEKRKPRLSHGRQPRPRRDRRFFWIRIVGGIFVVFLAIVTSFSYKTGVEADGRNQQGMVSEPVKENAKILDLDLTGLDAEGAASALKDRYPWDLKVVCQEMVYQVPDLLSEKVKDLLPAYYASGKSEPLSLEALGEEAARLALEAAAAWERPAAEPRLSGYDSTSGTFLFDEGTAGLAIDKEALRQAVLQAVLDKRFDAVVEVSAQEIPLSSGGEDARSRYRVMGSFTTKTTANQNRNTNILLSSQALNGTIVEPGAEFSFNEGVGQRTAAKGYRSATAYSNGAVVQEIGGGVCQVSTTLYNAVVASGLETTLRQSHTFQPTYVTPGMDATVSWGGPDYKFRNQSDAPVGILAEFKDRVLTISIYGLPVLEEGVTRSLESVKTASLGAPAPSYVEDPTLPPGTESVRKSGSGGSKWTTYLVTARDGAVVSKELDHTSTYKGHAGVVARNSSAVQVTLPATDPAGTAGQLPVEPGQPTAEPGQTPAEPGQTPVEPGQPPVDPGQTTADPGQTPVGPGQPGNGNSGGPGSHGPSETGGPGGAEGGSPGPGAVQTPGSGQPAPDSGQQPGGGNAPGPVVSHQGENGPGATNP